MEQFRIFIDRKRSFSKSIGGDLSMNGTFLCHTLELPWLWNERSISRAPPGSYSAFLRYDKPDGWRIQLYGVANRSGIQMHIGNYPQDTQGCILVGMALGFNTVFDSRLAYKALIFLRKRFSNSNAR